MWQETKTDASNRDRNEAGRRRTGEALSDGEQVTVCEEGKRADADHSGGQPVQPIHEVHRILAEDDEEHRDRHRRCAIQRDDLVGQWDPQHLDA